LMVGCFAATCAHADPPVIKVLLGLRPVKAHSRRAVDPSRVGFAGTRLAAVWFGFGRTRNPTIVVRNVVLTQSNIHLHSQDIWISH
jgi:hypothetical protein